MGIFVQKAKMGFIESPLKIWKYFYELIVLNIDYYHQSLKSKEKIELLWCQKQNKLVSYFKDYQVACFIPNWLLKLYCSTKVRCSIWINMNHVNLNKMQKHSIKIYQNEAPLNLRIKLILTVIVIDKICFVIQIFICKFCFNSVLFCFVANKLNICI